MNFIACSFKFLIIGMGDMHMHIHFNKYVGLLDPSTSPLKLKEYLLNNY